MPFNPRTVAEGWEETRKAVLSDAPEEVLELFEMVYYAGAEFANYHALYALLEAPTTAEAVRYMREREQELHTYLEMEQEAPNGPKPRRRPRIKRPEKRPNPPKTP